MTGIAIITPNGPDKTPPIIKANTTRSAFVLFNDLNIIGKSKNCLIN